jgi:hypothetical protein
MTVCFLPKNPKPLTTDDTDDTDKRRKESTLPECCSSNSFYSLDFLSVFIRVIRVIRG